MKRLPTLGALFGTAAALGVLAWLSFVLLDSEGANYKVLVGVWLWLLPAVGVGAGFGYAAGKIVEAFTRAKSSDQEGGVVGPKNSCGRPFVLVMQSTEHRMRDHASSFGSRRRHDG